MTSLCEPLAKYFQGRGRVPEFENTDNTVETDLEKPLDIVFLDIHLPGGSGIDILVDILSFDDSAYVILISGDSIKDKIMNGKKFGAKGFIAKPFTKEKLESFYEKCPTISSAHPEG
jgi:two-component system chemotaxis response regulator CheY